MFSSVDLMISKLSQRLSLSKEKTPKVFIADHLNCNLIQREPHPQDQFEMTQQPMAFSNARGRDKEVARLQAEVAAGAPKLQELSQQIDQLVASGDQGLQSQVRWQAVRGSVGRWVGGALD
jgi:hypothetical protein